MAARAMRPLNLPTWSRTLEWSVMGLVVAMLVATFMHYMRVVQGQGEFAAVRSTLGALRTALVIDHLQRSAAQVSNASVIGSVSDAQRNPFDLLQHRPTNYSGVASREHAAAVMLGTWVFDPVCPCVGYRPLNDLWFDSPSGEFMAWFQLHGAPGPSQLTGQEIYRWQELVLD